MQIKQFFVFSNDTSNNISLGTKLGWIDVVRVFATILVVLGHCTYYNIDTPYGGIHYINTGEVKISFVFYLLSTITKFIYSFHMPLFIIVSGMCFAISSSKYAKLVSLLENKFSKLIVPFILVTTLLSVPLKCISGYYSCSDSIISDIFKGQYLLLGNSHLWYVVSLFYIFVFFKLIYNMKMHNHIIVWLLLLLFSFVGYKIHPSHFELFGITGFLKYCLFFSAGFNFVTHFSRTNTTFGKNIISWILMFLCWFYLYRDDNVLSTISKFHLKTLFNIMFGIWGSINMIYLCKIISTKCYIQNTSIFKTILNKSYSIYLYSDPINYVIIFVLFQCFENCLFSSNFLPILAYLLRFIGSLVFAIILARLINQLNSKKV